MIATALVVLLAAAAAVPKPTNLLSVQKPADLSLPVVLKPGEAAIVIGWRRPETGSIGKSGIVAFARYDVEKRDMIARPADAKKNGDQNTYWIQANGGNKKLPLDHLVMVVSAGDYVLYGATPGPAPQVANTFCFSAPTFRVNAGETVYFGDISPYFGKRDNGEFAIAMAYSSHPDDARAALAKQPALAAAFRPADIRNGASYTCSGQAMTAYLVPGAPALPPLTAEARAAQTGNAPVPTPRKARPAPGAPILIPTNG
ncbi:hypothetical protein [Sandarakinorhabdus sp. DWP1-3-1]|uniref:hypothetical protein n=1 Tax=Sandarakinorhabdus sp. DWP1-3-1 TaxID=2804627 RepID=UPI003CE8BA9A